MALCLCSGKRHDMREKCFQGDADDKQVWMYDVTHKSRSNSYSWSECADRCLVRLSACCVGGTVAGDLLSLPLKVLGAVGLERRESPQLLETIEERQLLLLCVRCQNLLRQAQFLVGLPLLAGRWHSRRSRAGVLAGVGRLSGSGRVLYDLCVDYSGKTFQHMAAQEQVENNKKHRSQAISKLCAV